MQIEIEYPLGHRRRRAEAIPEIVKKFKHNMATHYTQRQLAPVCIYVVPISSFVKHHEKLTCVVLILFVRSLPSRLMRKSLRPCLFLTSCSCSLATNRLSASSLLFLFST